MAVAAGLTAAGMAHIFMGVAGTAQATYTGISTIEGVNKHKQNAEQLCETNKALFLQKTELQQALNDGLANQVAIDKLNNTVLGWQSSYASSENYAALLRKQFLQRYVIFLIFLTIITMSLFFVIDKKAGRLDKLFRKIGRIVQADKT